MSATVTSGRPLVRSISGRSRTKSKGERPALAEVTAEPAANAQKELLAWEMGATRITLSSPPEPKGARLKITISRFDVSWSFYGGGTKLRCGLIYRQQSDCQ